MSFIPDRAQQLPQLPYEHAAWDDSEPTFERAQRELEAALRAFADVGEQSLERILVTLRTRSSRAANAFQDTWQMLGLEQGSIGTPDDFANVARAVLRRMECVHACALAGRLVNDASKVIDVTLKDAVRQWSAKRVAGL